jgi:hypothetical protein
MNGPEPYDRRLDRLPDEAAPRPEAVQAADPPALAVRRDPSQQPVMPSQQSAQGIAWVRPTELAMRVGSPVAGRGIDLQTALATQARRVPSSIARAGRRTTRSAIARPATTTASEGLEL